MLICSYKKQFSFPDREVCGAYAASRRADGKFWAHYPECDESCCPLRHPELLEGAYLEPKPTFLKIDASDYNATVSALLTQIRESLGDVKLDFDAPVEPQQVTIEIVIDSDTQM